MTQKLYDLDSHMSRFEATVLSCEERKERWHIVLDRTAFFPEAGGQTADTGRIGEAIVSDVHEKGGIITHIADRPVETGKLVPCELDWEVRFRKMQNHTGEHIVSGITNRLYGYSNVGFHLGSEDVTLDFDGELTREQLNEIEYLANKAVSRDLSVTVVYPSPEELAEMEYRSKLELTENVRIVTIEDCDRCACCAPHVGSTGEVGLIKLLDFARHKGGVRIHMQCGLDALDDYREKYRNIQSISAQLSAKQHETAQAVTRLLEEHERVKFSAGAWMGKYVELRLQTLVCTGRNLCVFEDDMNAEGLRGLANGMTALTDGVCGAFSARPDGGWNYIIASRTVPLRSKAKRINEALSGRGGGTDEMIQGSAACAREQIEALFAGEDL